MKLFKINNQRTHYDLRRYTLANKVVNTWNSLPNSVVSTSTVNTSKTAKLILAFSEMRI